MRARSKRSPSKGSHKRVLEPRSEPRPAQGAEILGDAAECSVCLEAMLGCIFACTEGHAICQNCHTDLPRPKRCGVCRRLFPDPPPRQRRLEEVIGRVPFRCKYNCGVMAPPAELQRHMLICGHAPVQCPCRGCDQVDIVRGDLLTHWRRTHSGDLLRACRPAFKGELVEVLRAKLLLAGLDTAGPQNKLASRLSTASPHSVRTSMTTGEARRGAWFELSGVELEGESDMVFCLFYCGGAGQVLHFRLFHATHQRRVELSLGPQDRSVVYRAATEPVTRCSYSLNGPHHDFRDGFGMTWDCAKSLAPGEQAIPMQFTVT